MPRQLSFKLSLGAGHVTYSSEVDLLASLTMDQEKISDQDLLVATDRLTRMESVSFGSTQKRVSGGSREKLFFSPLQLRILGNHPLFYDLSSHRSAILSHPFTPDGRNKVPALP
ncbi:hypothetical protein L6452_06718 [Arctium lappa]|uniref:Uncharacterized protein n=1 Tax=Arctium lappa TaxID=4217 RepID=A0ACB9EJC0_ARCLA|nr:hypothetical protein L6452_06718 [Arctium lappa]